MFSTNKPFKFTALPYTLAYVREGDDAAAIAAAAAQADMAAKIDAAVTAATLGLKSKNDELLGKLKESNTKLGAYGTLDPARAKAMLETLDADEDMKLFAEGKKNLVIEKHTERMRLAHTAELEAERALTVGERGRAEAYRGAVLDNQIRAVTADCHKGAIDDALLQARQIFTLDAKGNAVKLDSEGRPELGKDGKTPFSPAEWMEMQRELKPHWFPASTSGSGSQGANGSAAGRGKTIKRSAFDQLSITQQGETARSGVTIAD